MGWYLKGKSQERLGLLSGPTWDLELRGLPRAGQSGRPEPMLLDPISDPVQGTERVRAVGGE